MEAELIAVTGEIAADEPGAFAGLSWMNWLLRAASSGDTRLAEQLLSVHWPQSPSQCCVVQLGYNAAARNGHVSMLVLLEDRGAIPIKKTQKKKGLEATMKIAAEAGQYAICVHLFLKHNLSLTSKALKMAVHKQDRKMLTAYFTRCGTGEFGQRVTPRLLRQLAKEKAWYAIELIVDRSKKLDRLSKLSRPQGAVYQAFMEGIQRSDELFVNCLVVLGFPFSEDVMNQAAEHCSPIMMRKLWETSAQGVDRSKLCIQVAILLLQYSYCRLRIELAIWRYVQKSRGYPMTSS